MVTGHAILRSTRPAVHAFSAAAVKLARFSGLLRPARVTAEPGVGAQNNRPASVCRDGR